MTIMIVSQSEKPLSKYYYYQGSNTTIHHETITISNPQRILMNIIDFIKTGLPVKTSNIYALSNVSFTAVLTNSFSFLLILTKQKL